MTMWHLDFSIGPVQGFVAQSRRTRDLWGSSYLLSFLSAHAMAGMEEADGEVVKPIVKGDPLYRWVCGQRGGNTPKDDAPTIGSLPNRFVVQVDGDPRAVADAGVDALQRAWGRVSRAVWERFVQDAATEEGQDTKAIWDRQITSFWEVTWTAGGVDSPLSASLFARRKHWRSHRLPDEPGDKCTVMHNLQELSGYVRSQDLKPQDLFWKQVRQRTGALDLRDNERLCAIALIKRLFPKTRSAALGWEVNATFWPSTVHIGARPWIQRVQSAAPEILNLAQDYAETVKQAAPMGVLSERWLAAAPTGKNSAGDFPKLDANYYHRGFIKSERLCPLKNENGQGEENRLLLDQLLKDLYKAKDEADKPLGPPPSFYALLLADGDRLGKLAGELGTQKVGEALGQFTKEVPGTVANHGGETIYAGGDDVLAMLPVTEALACGRKLAECYRRGFKDEDGKDAPGATLSAAVVFAHMRLPLNAVIRQAHHLLDDVAKEENGRDSLAVGVLKAGGLNCQWVSTWYRGQKSTVEWLNDLIRSLEADASDPGLSSALIYRIRDTFTRLSDWDQWQPGFWGKVPSDLDVCALLRADIGHSLAIRQGDDQAVYARAADLTEHLIWPLMQRCRAGGQEDPLASQAGAHQAGGKVEEAGLDALLLARFLADKVYEEADG